MSNGDFNNGKDIMLEDIVTEPCEYNGRVQCRAYLALSPLRRTRPLPTQKSKPSETFHGGDHVPAGGYMDRTFVSIILKPKT